MCVQHNSFLCRRPGVACLRGQATDDITGTRTRPRKFAGRGRSDIARVGGPGQVRRGMGGRLTSRRKEFCSGIKPETTEGRTWRSRPGTRELKEGLCGDDEWRMFVKKEKKKQFKKKRICKYFPFRTSFVVDRTNSITITKFFG